MPNTNKDAKFFISGCEEMYGPGWSSNNEDLAKELIRYANIIVSEHLANTAELLDHIEAMCDSPDTPSKMKLDCIMTMINESGKWEVSGEKVYS